MAAHGGTDLVTDGLEFCLDAFDTDSYSGAGSTAKDVGGGLSGTITGATHSDGADGAFTFDGSDDNIDFGTNLGKLPENGYSVCAWIYPDSGMSDKPIVGTAHSANSDDVGFHMRVRSNYKIRLITLCGGYDYRDTSSAISTSSWNHVCGTYNASSRTTNMYLNGSSNQGSNSNNGSIGTFNNTRTIKVGGTGGSSNVWDGKIAIVQLYNRVLSATEVSKNFNAQRGRFGV
mgnify:CR=1 FL=1